MSAVQGHGGLEIRQGVRGVGEVQGGEIHLGGGAAVSGLLKRAVFRLAGLAGES